MEAEMGVSPISLLPLPPEEQAIKNIMWSLEDEAAAFEAEQTAAPQAAQGFVRAPVWQPPPPEVTYSGLLAGYEEEDPWFGVQTTIWDEGDAGQSGMPFLPPAPSYQIPGEAHALSEFLSLPEQPGTSQAEASAADRAAAQRWQQQLAGLQAVGDPLGVPAPPAPSAGDFYGPPPIPPQFPSLSQQQQPSGSQGAGATGDSGNTGVSSHEGEGDNEMESLRKDKEKPKFRYPRSRVRRNETAKESWRKRFAAKAAAYRATLPNQKGVKVTAALLNFDGASTSGVGAGGASGEVSRPNPGKMAASGSSASEETTSQGSLSATHPVQPTGLVVSEGSISITLISGETISFAHPPSPAPPDTPAHYRLPVVPREAIQTEFDIRKALLHLMNNSPYLHLSVIHGLLRRPVLDSSEVEALVIRCQALVHHAMSKCLGSIFPAEPYRLKERLAVRFLIFEALVICIQLLGPAMKAEMWFPQLVAAVPTDFTSFPRVYSPDAHLNLHLSKLLSEGLELLKKGKRPSLQLTFEIKRLLFAPGVAPRAIPERMRKKMWPRQEKSREEEQEESETTSDED
ncbi:hypothetical protein ACSSS7_007379 [Eimeria intestinalis]